MRQLAALAFAFAAGLAGAADDGLSARAVEDAVRLRDATNAGSGAFAIVESLTTEVGPRMAGTPADAVAVAWARAKFQALGFDKVYVEPVTFPSWIRRSEHAEVVA